ncbi:EFR1 family ferrodoxin [Eubacterium sp. 1001713B170207_170306_E7]|uniref:EFR1 family ferrodoxin n=1 Tax=Eubacterium sp. 1001713B170207_170306_E7 TaxID=2787097 RepID=UPI001898F949|nr:EFR1 family ferrodoxin [Eubacterium sp. 1001713B170207_170306_E7]
MTGIYFSGTGNSKHCVEQFLEAYGGDAPAFSIEAESVADKIREQAVLVIGYPVQFSNIPKILSDFVARNQGLWRGKKVFVLATMGLFSGDGAGVLARLLRKHGAVVTGGLHLKMPDSICDEKALKRSLQANRRLIAEAELKIKRAVQAYKKGNPPQEGLGPFYHLAGLLGQRLYFYNKTKKYSDRLKIDGDKCAGCGKCVGLCPTGNLRLDSRGAVAADTCTMCYRCISRCPAQAITLLGKRVVEQGYLEKYRDTASDNRGGGL